MNSVALETFVSLKQTTLPHPFRYTHITHPYHTWFTVGVHLDLIGNTFQPSISFKKNKANDQIGESPHATICLLADDCSSSLLASRISTSP
jgi:hypothetical protein